MYIKMKFLLMVVIVFTLAMHEIDSAKKSKRSIASLKNQQHQEKIGRTVPKEGRHEAQVQEGKKYKKDFPSSEKRNFRGAKDSKWREQVKLDDAKGKQKGARKRGGLEQVSTSIADKREIGVKPKKPEQLRSGSLEELSEDVAIMEDKPKQIAVDDDDGSLMREEEDYSEEEIEETIMGAVEECQDSKIGGKMSRKCPSKTKETILIQEDMDGKCYYEL